MVSKVKTGLFPRAFKGFGIFRIFFLAALVLAPALDGWAQGGPQALSPEERDFLEKNPVLYGLMSRGIWPLEQEVRAALEATLPVMEGKNLCADRQIGTVEAPAYGFLDAGLVNLIAAKKIKMAWFVYASITGCGNEEVFRFIVVQNPNDTYAAILNVKGRTHAWPTLVNDAMLTVYGATALETVGKDCPPNAENLDFGPLVITDDSAIGPVVFGIRNEGSWEETWRIRVCDDVFRVPVSFRADGVGGAYFDVSQEEITRE